MKPKKYKKHYVVTLPQSFKRVGFEIHLYPFTKGNKFQVQYTCVMQLKEQDFSTSGDLLAHLLNDHDFDEWELAAILDSIKSVLSFV